MLYDTSLKNIMREVALRLSVQLSIGSSPSGCGMECYPPNPGCNPTSNMLSSVNTQFVLDPVHAKSASREAAPAFLWVKDKVHESAEHGFFVAVFSEEIVGTPEQVLQLMDFGE